jgi:hypothetical protein
VQKKNLRAGIQYRLRQTQFHKEAINESQIISQKDLQQV